MLTGVTPVILGMLRLAPRSGYDIKRVVDRSTRFFWAASYGQIYPELRRLQGEGLIRGESTPTGGRRRTVYRITSAGEAAHDEWLRAPGAGYELRDLGLLKLFFADLLPREEQLALLRELRDERRRILERLQQIKDDPQRPRRDLPEIALDFGIDTHAFWASWFDRAERDLRARRRKGAT